MLYAPLTSPILYEKIDKTLLKYFSLKTECECANGLLEQNDVSQQLQQKKRCNYQGNIIIEE
jgi:hypothetical protein